MAIDPEIMRRLEQQASLIRQLQGVAASGARVYNSANISIATGVGTALTFNSERFDVGGYHSISSDTGRLTAPSNGLHLIGCCVRWGANATGIRTCAIRLNGATTIAAQDVDIDSAINHAHSVVALYQLAAGDYVEVVVAQNSGGNLNVEAAGNFSPEFWITQLGPT